VALAQGGLILLLAAAGCGGTATVTQTFTVTTTHTVTAGGGGSTTSATPTGGSACSGPELGGTFAVVKGSAGAGQISYELTLTNSSKGECFVSGIPDVVLLDSTGSQLPTHATAAQPGVATAARIVLKPGDSAYAQARFSPDVPGPTEQHSGPCEPQAHTLRVFLTGGGSVDAPVQPPTSVCEEGAMRFDLLSSTP
jgi:hypothetical protein